MSMRLVEVEAQRHATSGELRGARVFIKGIELAAAQTIAQCLASQGVRLLLGVATRTPHINALAASLETTAEAVHLIDCTAFDGDVARKAATHFGGLDVVVNVFAMGLSDGDARATPDDIDDTLARGLDAAVRVTAVMANRQRLTLSQGLILNVGTLEPSASPSLNLVGNLLKSTLAAMTAQEAHRWTEAGLRINAIVVGPPDHGDSFEEALGFEDPQAYYETAGDIAVHLAKASGAKMSGYMFETRA